MIRVLVVDDHELVRIGLRHILADYPSIQIAGEAVDGESALRMNREIRPDVVLLDVCLPGLSGFEVTTRLKQASPELGIIILTVHEQAPYPAQLLEAGASAYLTKGCPATELVQAITDGRERRPSHRLAHRPADGPEHAARRQRFAVRRISRRGRWRSC